MILFIFIIIFFFFFYNPEIPLWLKDYVDAPFGSEMDKQIQVSLQIDTHKNIII